MKAEGSEGASDDIEHYGRVVGMVSSSSFLASMPGVRSVGSPSPGPLF